MKTAIVTGSSKGIGKAIALRLASEGMQVVLCARDEHLLQETAALCRNAYPVALDLREPEAGQQLVEGAVAKFGSIDILVNNAGATKRGDFEALTDEDWVEGYALKLFGTVRLTRAAWCYLRAAKGSVLNIAGVGGKTPGAEFTIGGSVNAALLSFTKALADKGLEDGVQVNAINPGPVRTDRLTRRLMSVTEEQFVAAERVTRIGEPDDIAALASFVLSDSGRWMHGSLIDMDGGSTKSL